MIISWGVPTIKATKLAADGSVATGDAAKAVTFPTPVDGSTQLSTEKGNKMEALVEGGEPEAIKYKRGRYTLEFQVRFGAGRKPEDLIDGTDGVVEGEWQLELEAEDKASGAPGFKFPKSVCSYEDSYTSEDGIIRTYSFESLKPASGAQVNWVFPTV